MSSGVVKNSYQRFPKTDLHTRTLFNLGINSGQKRKFHFISELILLLFAHKNSHDSYKNISNLINLSLETHNENYTNILFSSNSTGFLNYAKIGFNNFVNQKKKYTINKNTYLLMLNRVRSILNSCTDMTNDQKFDYYSIERYFMKLYLRECLKKNLTDF